MSGKVEQEIEEILKKAGVKPGSTPASPEAAPKGQPSTAGGLGRRATKHLAAKLAVGGLAALVAGMALHPLSTTWGNAALITGGGLLILAYLVSLKNVASRQKDVFDERRWRGRSVEMPPQGGRWWDRIRGRKP